MRIDALCVAAALAVAVVPAVAAPNDLADLRFLVGRWSSGDGLVADTGQRSSGTSVITEEAGGAALLRRDHTELTGADGKAAGGFDQVMLIVRDGDAIHGDYADGAHVIEYRSALVEPGVSVTFLTRIATDRPAFRLTYRLRDPNTLTVRFEIAPPGATTFTPVATGTLTRAP